MKTGENSIQSYWNRIQIISFILAVFVVIRHNSSLANYDESNMIVSHGKSLYSFFRNSITEIAVPLFFILSGLNFFRDYTQEKYKQKFKSRIKSLLIPYLLWNCIYVLFNIIISLPTFSQYFIGREKFEISLWNVVTSCLYHWTCNGHFWFVFNLILFVLLNPIVFFLLRSRVFGLVTLITLYVVIFILNFALPIEFIYRTDSIFYYYLGAFIGLNYPKLCVTSIQYKSVSKVALGGALLLTTILFLFNPPYMVRPGIVLTGSMGMFLISSAWKNSVTSITRGGTTFTLYAAHGIFQPILVKCIYLILPKSGLFSIVNFVLAVGLTVALCVLMRCINQKYLPAIDHLLTGWRR